MSSMAASSAISSPFITPKDGGVSSLSAQSSSSIKVMQKKVSTKIVSVMTPQQSERKPSTTGSVKTGMTMTEKIFSRASEKSQLIPGENVWVNIDILMTHDVCGPGSIGIFKKEFGNDAKTGKKQQTIGGCIEKTGATFHSGNHTTVRIWRALAGKGRYFDFCSRLVPASIDYAQKISATIVIAHVNDNHYIKATLFEDCPLPLTHPFWITYKSENGRTHTIAVKMCFVNIIIVFWKILT